MSKERIWHGGDLDKARRLFPEAPEPWIDLSTGINPIPYPLPDLPPHLFERLPSPRAQMDLEVVAAEAYGAVDAATVMAAPGTQVLINLLPVLWPRSQVAVLAPTYAEHAHAWRMARHQVTEAASLEQAENADIVVLVNPNNPDGRVLKRCMLLGLSERLRQRGGWLVIDEAFADFESDESLVPHLPENAVILRSFGKTYGLAGLRLGFAIAASETVMRLRRILGPWAVSGPAIAVGKQALLDRDWRDAAQQARDADARRLDALLGPVSDQVPRGTTLYRLIESRHASDLFAHLGRRGIWVRRFEYNPRILRLGLPGSEAAWTRLGEAIAAFRNAKESE
ncbi:threonine-phosphate decarboxylase CobD [Microvirga makkahensis]|uniref:8-amino-7-oxononanoate synthase n=1 Tax=Microvirga makkahensis TaxID=1128670 RepID=A0A7X3MVC9_9HYPH|nr:threonine-phosphate decarboxylase CobD [Microvirga makkahensis]MXQ13917.1 threonine-phosphate decarboxylase [Microvirga makkahensis]